GGEGSRLRPLTIQRPKPLVNVCNKPVMLYIVELLKKHGIEQIVVTLHYLADEIVSYFGDGSDFGVQMIYSVEDTPLGTAGSVKQAEKYLGDTFIIISGDALTDFNLTDIINFHREKGATATITLTRVDNPLEYGVVITDEDGRIRRFLEKPSWGEIFSDTINTGIYVLEPEVFELMEEGAKYDFSKDIFPTLLEQDKPMYGYVASGYWCDIGNLQAYRMAHQDMFTGKVEFQMPGVVKERNIWIGEGTEIHPSVSITGPVVIGNNCRIKENVKLNEFTSIGDNCIIEESAFINRGILMENVYVGKNSRLNSCIVCKGSTLKSHVELMEGVILGDKCYVGDGATINQQVKIWPDKNIEAGANVNMSMIWAVRWPGSLFGEAGINGLGNIEITPEFAMKLGASYGAFLDKNAVVVTSRDSNPTSRMLNRAIICGLVSVGVNVHDLRVMPDPVSRYAIRSGGHRGGIHTRVDPRDSSQILLELYDSRGINLDKNTERKIENIFFREDFRRTVAGEVGIIDFPSRVLDRYSEGYFSNIDVPAVKQANFKVVVDYGYGNASLVLPHLLGKLGCETVAINAYLDTEKSYEVYENKDKTINQLSNIVTTLGAGLGLLIDKDAEKLILVDEHGRNIDGNLLLALYSLLVCRTNPGAMIAIPINAPGIIEKIAHENKGRAIRTKTDARSIMHTAALGEKKISFAGSIDGAFAFPEFQPVFDGMFSFVKLLELMAGSGLSLGDAREMIPEFYMIESQANCPWQKKGLVMRRLVEENRGHPMEMIEGIKVFFDGGWVLAIPDPTEPRIHIWAEGDSTTRAEELAGLMEEQIGKIVEEKEKVTVARKKSRRTISRKETPPTPATSQTILEEEKAFHFWTPGKYLGVKANSLAGFIDVIHYIEQESIDYHMARGDFANWIEYELFNPGLAEKVRKLKEEQLQGEEIRKRLLKLLQ
ncbi:MAG: mannose-1-phosphate guanyltransferase, partial [Candidatus Eremiobacteraeota bacterium]|nr:mannose-1-phosphate guanyltransferase [Candidatus Eremiobacteraeota bacterium]